VGTIAVNRRLELGRKPSKYAEEGDDVDALLDFLEKNNWLSQERFSESLIHRRRGNSCESAGGRVLAEQGCHRRGLTRFCCLGSDPEVSEASCAPRTG
jgi:hypothetical protein